MIKMILSGASGKMGRVISKLAKDTGSFDVVSGVDLCEGEGDGFPIYSSPFDFEGQADVIVDFSHPNAVDLLLPYIKERKIPAVIATTGLKPEQHEQLRAVSKDAAIFYSANMSLGISLLIELVTKSALLLGDDFDIEIVEKHHNQKIDAPSGTALALADAVQDGISRPMRLVYDRHAVRQKRRKSEIGMHAVRGGTIVGEHTVIFAGADEIIEIKHTATSKEIFAAGALRAAGFLIGKSPGLYSMRDIVRGSAQV